jgi:integrase
MVERIEDETATDVIILLFFTGLRQSEARGLRWSDWDEADQTLAISRAVWQTRVGGTKNPSSENTIPVLPLLQNLLTKRRERIHPQPQDYIFAGKKRGTPLNFHNLENRVIKPSLKDSPIHWAGFHGFRRGLASNLLALEVNPVIIARILRHDSVSTTLAFYARSREGEPRVAMEKLEQMIRNRPSNVIVNGKPV